MVDQQRNTIRLYDSEPAFPYNEKRLERVKVDATVEIVHCGTSAEYDGNVVMWFLWLNDLQLLLLVQWC